MCSLSSLPVTMITGSCLSGHLARTRLRTSNPLKPGMLMSSSTRSNRLVIEELERGEAAAGLDNLEAVAGKLPPQEVAVVIAVVDDEKFRGDAGHLVSRFNCFCGGGAASLAAF